MNVRIAISYALALLFIVSTPVWSQDKVNADASMREILESEKEAKRIMAAKEQSDPQSTQGQATPLASMLGLREAMQNAKFSKAVKFLDMRYLPEELAEFTPEQLVKALAYVWGQQNIFDVISLSDEPEGNLDDGLPSYREQIGSVTISSGDIPIYLQRVPDGRGGKVWKLSNATVAEIPKMWEELGYSPIATYFKNILPEFTLIGMDNWQVVATILFFLLAWPLAALLSAILMRIALLIPNRFPLGIQRFFKWPMRFFIFVLITRLLVNQLGLSLTARVFMESSGVDYIAYGILSMGIISLIRDYNIRKLQYAGNEQYAALLKPMAIIVKVILLAVMSLVWAESAGYNMSTILAGLGVGSLAVALAAQKTLENIIGAITLYTARPVNPGDFCRFGNAVGTVEEIGLRSTTIRTLNRTLVVIPNSVFSSLEIENYSVRDRIRFFQELRITLEAPEQINAALEKVRKLFHEHSEVIEETISIYFSRIDDGNAILRMDAGVGTTNYQEFLAVAEVLNLGIVDAVESAGAKFSGPIQALQFDEGMKAAIAGSTG
jgi:MscS family membrane protein